MEKRGIPTGYHAVHPITGQDVPIWIANFVLIEYGSGAVMSVPARDERDHEFALKYGLPISQVIAPRVDRDIDVQIAAFTEKGLLVNSGGYRHVLRGSLRRHRSQARKPGTGNTKVNHRLRDRGVSRQRYWCSIPMLTDAKGEAQPSPAGSSGSAAKMWKWMGLSHRSKVIRWAKTHWQGRLRCVKQTPSTRSWNRPGITHVTVVRITQTQCWIRQKPITGCRSINMSVALSTPFCTCSTHVFP